jgi:hypothetical protein
MLNIIGHKGNANQNHVKILPHSCLTGYHQEHKQQKIADEDVAKQEPYTLLVGM